LYREAEIKFGRNIFYQPPKGTNCKNVMDTGKSFEEKHKLELRCGVHWPCASNSKGQGGIAPNYESMPDNICPTGTGWTYDSSTGLCMSPRIYTGGCGNKVNMLGFTPGMKAQWAHACNAAWPLAPAKPKTVSQPPASPPGVAHPTAKEAEDNMEIEPKMPEKLKRSGVKLEKDGKEQKDAKEIAAGGMAGSAQLLPDRSDPSQAIFSRCGPDFKRPCPINWTENGTYCLPPSNYRGICPRNGVDMTRYSEDMKIAFQGHCSASWPCKGDIFMSRSSPGAKNHGQKQPTAKPKSAGNVVVMS
jgi:CPW-WPC domain-containing protein